MAGFPWQLLSGLAMVDTGPRLDAMAEQIERLENAKQDALDALRAVSFHSQSKAVKSALIVVAKNISENVTSH